MGPDENARPKRRNYFPDLDLGVDSNGRPLSERCVPIFHDGVPHQTEDSTTTIAGLNRYQFPLILCWALTHWKAQGMTLRRVKIKMGERIASSPGMGFTSCSRVKHPSHLLFETDLPPWEVFQEAKWKPVFRARRRMELRLRARASWTLRKYGYCRADRWTPEEADLAQKLLERLKLVGDLQRIRLKLSEDITS